MRPAEAKLQTQLFHELTDCTDRPPGHLVKQAKLDSAVEDASLADTLGARTSWAKDGKDGKCSHLPVGQDLHPGSSMTTMQSAECVRSAERVQH